MKTWTLAIVSSSVVAFLTMVGAAWGGTPQDAHDRAASVQQSMSASLTDAHDRGDQAVTLLPDGRALRLRIEQLDRASLGAIRDSFHWSEFGIGAGAALVLAGLVAVLLLVVRHERKLAAP
jgi:hypothetical protein